MNTNVIDQLVDNKKNIIDINGSKIEVDFSSAKKIDTFKIGSPVKVLTKDYTTWKCFPGVIIGIDDFKDLPTIVVLYLQSDYSSAALKYAYINKETTDTQICLTNEKLIGYNKTRILDLLDNEILATENKAQEAKAKKKYFLDCFNAYFSFSKFTSSTKGEEKTNG